MNPEGLRTELRAAIVMHRAACTVLKRNREGVANAEITRDIEERKLSAIRGLLDAYEIERMDIEKEFNP